jgi:uncharacterized protein (TIGR02996 family)
MSERGRESLDERALVAAVAARPDDLLPRLVYADWLDEHGEADRAELVRLACQGVSAPRRLAELRAGLPAGRADRVDPLPPLTAVEQAGPDLQDREGFEVSEVRVRAGERVAAGQELFALTLHGLFPTALYAPGERREVRPVAVHPAPGRHGRGGAARAGRGGRPGGCGQPARRPAV